MLNRARFPFTCIPALALAVSLVILNFAGCGGTDSKNTTSAKNSSKETRSKPPNQQNKSEPIAKSGSFPSKTTDDSPKKTKKTREVSKPPTNPPRRLGDLLDDKPFEATKMKVDDARAASKGIRKVTGKHLVLYTDLPADPEVDELPAVFDKAVPQWCEYFGIDRAKVEKWQMTGFLIKEKERFQGAELIPLGLPPFLNGYQQGYELWLYEQPSAYYRRHLMLHEGTHGFMYFWLGGIGPPWYAEGMAELLGTHRWQDGKLTLRYNPRSSDEVPYWGRVRIIKDKFAQGQAKSLDAVLSFGSTAHQKTEAYAWSWAAALFFDDHPDYRDKFRALQKRVKDPIFQFNADFTNGLKDDLPKIHEQWFLFIMEMEYGYDVARSAVMYKTGAALPASGATFTIAADRGWQSTGIRLEAGTTYEISAKGRYQVADQPTIWWCEPGGVTIKYHRGEPLGKLMGAVRMDEDPIPHGAKGPYLARSAPIGLGREIKAEWTGTLYLRINESPSDLHDNAGELTVRIVAK